MPGEVAARHPAAAHSARAFCAPTPHRRLLTNRTPEAHQWALEQFRKLRSEGQFVPFSVGQQNRGFPWI